MPFAELDLAHDGAHHGAVRPRANGRVAVRYGEERLRGAKRPPSAVDVARLGLLAQARQRDRERDAERPCVGVRARRLVDDRRGRLGHPEIREVCGDDDSRLGGRRIEAIRLQRGTQLGAPEHFAVFGEVVLFGRRARVRERAEGVDDVEPPRRIGGVGDGVERRPEVGQRLVEVRAGVGLVERRDRLHGIGVVKVNRDEDGRCRLKTAPAGEHLFSRRLDVLLRDLVLERPRASYPLGRRRDRFVERRLARLEEATANGDVREPRRRGDAAARRDGVLRPRLERVQVLPRFGLGGIGADLRQDLVERARLPFVAATGELAHRAGERVGGGRTEEPLRQLARVKERETAERRRRSPLVRVRAEAAGRAVHLLRLDAGETLRALVAPRRADQEIVHGAGERVVADGRGRSGRALGRDERSRSSVGAPGHSTESEGEERGVCSGFDSHRSRWSLHVSPGWASAGRLFRKRRRPPREPR